MHYNGMNKTQTFFRFVIYCFRMTNRLLFSIALLFILHWSHTQEEPNQVTAKYISEDILLDGELNEAVWLSSEKHTNFWQYFPTDSLRAKYQTIIQFAYNETTLFVAIKAEAIDNNFVISSLRRDFSGIRNDNVSILFDTFNDGTNAFGFGITPYGVRREFSRFL